GDEKENARVLGRFVKAFLVERPERPSLNGEFPAGRGGEMNLQGRNFSEEEPERKKEDDGKGNIPPDGLIKEEDRDEKSDDVAQRDAAKDLGLPVTAACVNDHDGDFADGA
ncbi:MAG: hypothetical protein U1D97_09210, partial [Desulfuromonadales bacterium]|nr:hypothetical protein [Desulfuromonadales bacterium]